MIAKNRTEMGARLRQERDRLCLTQDEIADKTDVSKRTQAAWEKGEQVPHAEYLALAAVLGMDILYVVTGQHAWAMQSQAMGAFLHPDESDLLNGFRRTSPAIQQHVRGIVAALAAQHGTPPVP